MATTPNSPERPTGLRSPEFSRRDFLRTSTLGIGASALSGVLIPRVHAQGSDQLRIALIGCGGRGTGAAVNALSQEGAPKLFAMADVFQSKLESSFSSISNRYPDQVDVGDRKFLRSGGCISSTRSKRA